MSGQEERPEADSNFAIPLFSIVDRSKVDTRSELPEAFAEHLQAYLEGGMGIRCLFCKFLRGGDDVLLVLHGVSKESLPALCSLVDVQKTTLYRYERSGEDSISLTPLAVKV